METWRVRALPEQAGSAAAEFYGQELPGILRALRGNLVIVFPPADYTHNGWRLAAVQQLAREHAPIRVNAVAGEDEAAIAAALAYLAGAEGITGQYLRLDGQGAGKHLSSSP